MPKILIVEDQDETRKMLRLALRKHVTRTLEAPNGTDALQMIRDDKPDVVLLDIVMPGEINGFKTCEIIKSDVALKKSFVILISGLSAPSDFQEARRVGANAYFVKPFRLARLAEVVENHQKFEKTFLLENSP